MPKIIQRGNKYSTIKEIKVSVDEEKPSMTIETNWYFIGILIFLIIVWSSFAKKLTKRLRSKYFRGKVKVSIKTGIVDFEQEITRSFENIHIANRIYIELVTRKAAIPFEAEHDVIEEVHDSWYVLFGIIREEIKKVPGEFISKNDTEKLIELSTEILNKGLRPHLTKYQARFRKWYHEQLEDQRNIGIDPQKIQAKYPDHELLVKDLHKVNSLLIDYSQELNKLIRGENSNE